MIMDSPTSNLHGETLFSKGFGLLKMRLSGRPDSEHEQAIIRVVIVFFVLLYFFSPAYTNGIAALADLEKAQIGIVLLWSFSLLLLGSVIVRPNASPLRRIVGMIGDLGGTSYFLAISGVMATPLIAVYLWVTMGNGFRYGLEYLLASAVLSIIGFSFAFYTSEFWSSHEVFAISMLIILVVIPTYMATLLRKLNHALDQAKQASAAKTQFLANMSHELRTPLNGVIGISDLLIDTRLNAEQHELARIIQGSAHTLLDLIENILDISKIEAGKLSSERVDFDLHRLVSNTAQMFAPQAERSGIALATHVAPETPFLLHGDAAHLRQVLINLTGNAIKFTEVGRVEIRVNPVTDRDDGLWIRFEIIDTGVGIPKQARQRIFEHFTQADQSTTRRFGGTGLGTTIAKQLVNLMDGEIGVVSKPGEGSTFWFELPFEIQQATQLVTGPADPPSKTHVCVLAGEELASDLWTSLQRWNIHADFVPNSALAVSALVRAAVRDKLHRIALVERQQLGMEGGQFIAALRTEDALKHLSVVLIDTEIDRSLDEAFLQAGFSSVLHTPLDNTLLFNAIHAAHSEHAASENVVSLAEHYRQKGAARKLHVLVAEDNETNQRVIKGILNRAGHEVQLVNDGQQALDVLESHGQAFDLIILDMNMPILSGLDVMKAYRFMDTRSSVPVVILTADATREALEACRQAGADSFLTKPLHAQRLLDTVAALTRVDGAAPVEDKAVVQPLMPDPETDKPAAKLDESKLDALAELASGPEFVQELSEGFTRDGERLMAQMRCAVTERDYADLRDAAHALKGTAAELGSVVLVKLCKQVETLKPYDMSSEKPAALVEQIISAFGTTCMILSKYVESRCNAIKN